MCLAPACPSTSLCSARVVTVLAFHWRYSVKICIFRNICIKNFVNGSFSQEDFSEVYFKQMRKSLNFTNYCEIISQPIFQEHFFLRNSQIITQRAYNTKFVFCNNLFRETIVTIQYTYTLFQEHLASRLSGHASMPRDNGKLASKVESGAQYKSLILFNYVYVKCA